MARRAIVSAWENPYGSIADPFDTSLQHLVGLSVDVTPY